MHHPTDRIIHTTAFVTQVVEHWLKREIAQWVHLMKDRSDDPSYHERTLLPRSSFLYNVRASLDVIISHMQSWEWYTQGGGSFHPGMKLAEFIGQTFQH